MMELVYILLLILFVLVIFKSAKFATPEYRGKIGELKTYNIIRAISEKYKVISNLFIPTANGGYTEIDTILITDRCIFVIETKNYSGWIFGDEKSRYWMSVVYQDKNQFYNPIMQNDTHIKYLKKQIGYKISIFSIIVFSDKCSFKKMNVYNSKVKVCHFNNLVKTIKDIINENNYFIKDEDIYNINEKLIRFTNVDEKIKGEHIKYIKNRYK